MFKELKSEFMLLIVAIIWATGFIATKIAIDTGMSVYDILLIRFILSSFLLNAILKVRQIEIKKGMIKSGLILAFFLSMGYLTQTLGIKYTTPARNALLTGTNIIFIPYISFFLFRVKIERHVIIASIIAFIGSAFLSGDIYQLGNFKINIGDMLSIMCAFLFACHIIFTGHYVLKEDPLALSFLQFVFSSIFLFIIKMIFDPKVVLKANGVFASIYMAIFCTFICYTLQFIAQKNVKASKAGIILSLEVVFAVIISLIIGYDKFTISMLIGFGLIFFAIILLETKLSFLLNKREKK